MGALTDEYENKIHADCEQLYTVLKNCDAPDQQERDAESIKALYRLVFLLSHRPGSKMMAITTTTASYLCHHPMLPVILVEILRDSKNIKVCGYVLDILVKLVLKNIVVTEADRKAARRAFHEPLHFRAVMQALRNLDTRFQPEEQSKGEIDLPDRKGYELQVRFLKIINCVYSRKGQSQISLVTDFTVEFLSRHFVKHAEVNTEISRCLLPLIKTICRNRKNCAIVCTESFPTAFVALVAQVNRYPTGISILKFLSRSPEALIQISRHHAIHHFIVHTAIYHSEKATHRKYLMSAMYRLAKTNYGMQFLKNTSLWFLLLEFFMKSERLAELRQRMSFTRAYTILHRGVPNKFVRTSPLEVEFEFAGDIQRYIHDRANHQSSDDSDNDEIEEEDEDEKTRCKTVSVSCDNDNEIENDDIDDSDEEHESDRENDEDKSETIRECEDNVIPNGVLHNDTQDHDFARFFSEFSGGNPDELQQNINIVDTKIYRHPFIDRVALPDSLPHVENEDDGCISPNINTYTPSELSKKVLTIKNYLSPLQPNIIYELDTLLKDKNYDVDIPNLEAVYINYLNKRPHSKEDIEETLKFESRFECGNLRRVERIDAYEYNLFLSPDINMTCGLQWFYFQVSGMRAQKTYAFNIVNFQKCNSQFSYGLQPVMFSTLDYALHSRGWHKCGSQVMYYGNEYISRESNKQFRTLRFCVTFDYDEDVCYFAYHYPYTYTRLMKVVLATLTVPPDDVFVRVDELTKSVGGLHPIVLITITARNTKRIGLDKRQLVFLTSRVHPGESNASWIIEGAIKYLLTDGEQVKTALECFIFKIIPLLNPEGVIYGNTRCGLTGNDLNRCWKKPHPRLHPEIYNVKKLVEYAREHLTNEIFTFIDIHGHSRKKFFFLYGCNAHQSWNDTDAILSDPEDTYNSLPRAMAAINCNLKLAYCKNTIERKRETTCRVVMWREFAIRRSHTLECSFCSGDNKKKITTGMLREIGETIIKALANQVMDNVDGASNVSS